jgi:Mor family transcriptional regulator
MPIEEKTRRNKRIYREYKPKVFGYDRLADAWGLSRWTIRQIIKREDSRRKNKKGG